MLVRAYKYQIRLVYLNLMYSLISAIILLQSKCSGISNKKKGDPEVTLISINNIDSRMCKTFTILPTRQSTNIVDKCQVFFFEMSVSLK